MAHINQMMNNHLHNNPFQIGPVREGDMRDSEFYSRGLGDYFTREADDDSISKKKLKKRSLSYKSKPWKDRANVKLLLIT